MPFPISVAFYLRLLLVGVCFLGRAGAADEFEQFEKRIRPVLAERCYSCHSQTAEKIKGGLLLDSRAGLLKGGNTGPVILPGDAEKSRLIEAIRYHNEKLQMPPEPKDRLTEQQVLDFVAWINTGAPDPRTNDAPKIALVSLAAAKTHWSFQPLKQPALPIVRAKEWPKSPIDFFVLAQLERNKLSPSALASKRTLVRRATYDLTGLPPKAEEVEEFVRDEAANAFEKVVDRLLASPRYGERWARHWLDVARYADTKGYVYTDREEARFVHSYSYRDWVIRALNEDLPYKDFLMQQIAADQLSSAQGSRNNNPALAAMGFLTLGRRFLGVTHDIIDDRIDVLTRGTLGLTVGCARCHDHKFDPISIRDYYSLYGVFYNSIEKTLPLVTSSDANSRSRDFQNELQKRVDKLTSTFNAKCDQLSNRLRGQTTNYLLAVLSADTLPSEEFYEIRGPNDLNPAIVRAWQSYLAETSKHFHPIFAPWHAFAVIPTRQFATEAEAVYQKFAAVKNPARRVNPLVLQIFEQTPQSMIEVAQRYGRLLTDVHQQWQERLKEAGTNSPPGAIDPNREPLRQVLYGSNSPVNVPAGAIVDLEWYFDEAGRVELAKLQSEIDKWINKSADAPPYAVILEDRPVLKPAHVFLRGNPANRGEEVPRQFLALLAGEKPQPFQKGSGRVELAQAIASETNPLTARVMVNRIWLHHFGAGLVRTASDFGTRSELPSHPELLDWLARRFMADGWSIKKLHRLIMLSSTYQQSSDPTSAEEQFADASLQRVSRLKSSEPFSISPLQVDPENRLLWRMNRQRLDFEAMRDSLLAVSGELDLTMGGKAVDLFGKAENKRRTIYGYIDRQFLPGVFRVFDFANPDAHSPQRHNTSVPQQALFFMNNIFVVERARRLTQRVEATELAGSPDRIKQLYRTVYQRDPTKMQLDLALGMIAAAEREPEPEPPKVVPSPWRYGFAELDASAKVLTNFQSLPHFTGEAWQGGSNWPDEKLGWAQLTAEGGHAGNDLQHAVVRRWVSPADGVVSITGTARHENTPGDGIRAHIISSRSAVLATVKLHNSKEELTVTAIEVRAGDSVDFIVDFHANLNSDMFKWNPTIKLQEPSQASSGDYRVTEWNSKKDFSGPPGPPPRPLSAWEKYAQVLLLSNEFMFVD